MTQQFCLKCSEHWDALPSQINGDYKLGAWTSSVCGHKHQEEVSDQFSQELLSRACMLLNFWGYEPVLLLVQVAIIRLCTEGPLQGIQSQHVM